MPREELPKWGFKDAIKLGAFTLSVITTDCVQVLFSLPKYFEGFVAKQQQDMCRVARYLTSGRCTGWGGRLGFNIFTKHWLASSKAKCVSILRQILSLAEYSHLLLVLGPRSQFHC